MELLKYPIAQSTFLLQAGSSNERRFQMAVEAPSQVSGGQFECLYQVEGLPATASLRRAKSGDAVSALQRALNGLAIIAVCIPYQFGLNASSSSWEGGAALSPWPLDQLEEGLAAYWRVEFSRALPLLKPFADYGVAELQLMVGSIYWLGLDGIGRQAEDAIRYLTAAAEQGNAMAYHYLAEVHSSASEDRPADRKLAAECARKAVDLGFPMASLIDD